MEVKEGERGAGTIKMSIGDPTQKYPELLHINSVFYLIPHPLCGITSTLVTYKYSPGNRSSPPIIPIVVTSSNASINIHRVLGLIIRSDPFGVPEELTDTADVSFLKSNHHHHSGWKSLIAGVICYNAPQYTLTRKLILHTATSEFGLDTHPVLVKV